MSNNKVNEEQKNANLAIELSQAAVLPLVLKSALELNIIDIISRETSGGNYLSPSEIAARIPTKNHDAPVLLDRVLRLLASYDVIKCLVSTKEDGKAERVYSAGAMCKFLTTNDAEGSLGPMFWMLNDEVFMKSWYHLKDTILEGGIPFNRANGMSAFEYPGIDQRFNKVFNHGLANYTTFCMKRFVEDYGGFKGLKVLVDVGGGAGVALNVVISKYPHIKGINFDLPHVVADSPSYPGVEHVGGDMFASVPKGDGIMMKSVLHDWRDESCVKILKNCYEALPASGKLILIDWVAPEIPENNAHSHMVFAQDLFMLAQNPGGKERTQKEFEALALKSGFSGFELHSHGFNNMCVMELLKSA